MGQKAFADAPGGRRAIASLTGAEPCQPVLGLGCAELPGALIPFARLRQVGKHALDAPAGELARVVGGGEQQGAARQAPLCRALAAWPDTRARYQGEEQSYEVRGQTIRVANHAETLARTLA